MPDWAFEQERQKTSEILSDRQGRHANEAAFGRHAVDPREDVQHHIEHAFASEITSALDRAAEKKDFDRIVVIAPPKMLGELRATMSKRLKSLLLADLDRDLVRATPAEIISHLGNKVVL